MLCEARRRSTRHIASKPTAPLGWTNRFFIKCLIPWHIIAELCSGESERNICPIWSFFTVDTGSRSNHAKVRIRAAKGV